MDIRYARGGPGDPTANAIERTVANFFGIRIDELHRGSTTRAVALPRPDRNVFDEANDRHVSLRNRATFWKQMPIERGAFHRQTRRARVQEGCRGSGNLRTTRAYGSDDKAREKKNPQSLLQANVV